MNSFNLATAIPEELQKLFNNITTSTQINGYPVHFIHSYGTHTQLYDYFIVAQIKIDDYILVPSSNYFLKI
jgi:hypothetical protein